MSDYTQMWSDLGLDLVEAFPERIHEG